MLRVAARDLAGATLDDVVAEVSAIADACIAAGTLALPITPTLAVIGLGKLGGHELNYASDVDLLFVHRDTGPDAQEAAERAVAALTAMLAQPTADGIALRVDVALRPGGRDGALSRSLGGDPRVLRPRVGDLGTPGHDQGAAGRGRPELGAGSSRASSRSCTRASSRPPRSTTCAARRCGSRSTSVGAARSSPRSSAAAAASGTWSSPCSCCRSCTDVATRGCARRTPSTPCDALAHEGYVADADADGARRRLSVPAASRAPSADRPGPADARPAARDAERARRSRARSASPTPTRSPRSTSARPSSSVRSTSGCSIGRCLESFAGPAQLHPSHGTDRAATEELLGA